MATNDVSSHSSHDKLPINEKMPEQQDLNRLGSCQNGESFEFSEHAGTKRNIKSRHAQMIAIGGSIGTLMQ
jgi:amino acid transporter